MSSDIRFDQNNITTVVDEQSFEDPTFGNEYLKIKRVAEGVQIEAVAPQSNHSPAVLDLNFGNAGAASRINLFKESNTNPTIALNASKPEIVVGEGTNYSSISSDELKTSHVEASTSRTKEVRVLDELYFENDFPSRIIRLRRGDDNKGQLQIKSGLQLMLSAQSSPNGGSVVLYGEGGTPTVILNGETGEIYLTGNVNENVDPSDMIDIAAALVWGN